MTSSVKEDALGWSLYSLYFVDLMKRDENDSFECLTCSYLMTDPAGTSQFSDVWLWGEYPGRRGRPDAGIGKVAKDEAGRQLPIQPKLYDADHVVGKKDFVTFIFASSSQKFCRLLSASTGGHRSDPPRLQQGRSVRADRKLERRDIQEAMTRMLEGNPIRSDGKLTVKYFAGKASVKRRILTHRHQDLQAGFRGRVATDGTNSEPVEELKNTIEGPTEKNRRLEEQRRQPKATTAMLERHIAVDTLETICFPPDAQPRPVLPAPSS